MIVNICFSARIALLLIVADVSSIIWRNYIRMVAVFARIVIDETPATTKRDSFPVQKLNFQSLVLFCM